MADRPISSAWPGLHSLIHQATVRIEVLIEAIDHRRRQFAIDLASIWRRLKALDAALPI